MQKFTDDDITLLEPDHQYKLKDDPGFEFTSCTTFVKYFFTPFDKIGIANDLTTNKPKYIHMTPQELVAEWNKAAIEGTLVHEEIERFIKDGVKPTHPKSEVAVKWIKEYLIEIGRYEIFSEVFVYSKELALAGTIDLLIYDKLKGTYKIVDWKTNKRIDTKSFDNRTGHQEATRNLMDCNFIHYSIQLSLYRYILENYYGLTMNGSAISHLTESNVQFYPTVYHENEIEEMLKADRVALSIRAEEGLTKEFV